MVAITDALSFQDVRETPAAKTEWQPFWLQCILLFPIIILCSASSAWAFWDQFHYFCLLFYFAFFLIYHRKFDLCLFGLILLWFLINRIAVYYWDSDISFNLISGIMIKLLISYLAIKTLGNQFWNAFERFIWILTLTALIIHLVLVCIPPLNPVLGSIFQDWVSEIYLVRIPDAWHSFFYTYMPEQENTLRNAGFMWEPGAFAMIICLGILLYSRENPPSFNTHTLVYLAALVSTFSTCGYGVLCLLMLWFIFNSSLDKGLKIASSILFFILMVVFLLYDTEVMLPKLKLYLENTMEPGMNNTFQLLEYNRLASFIIYGEKLLEYPLGFGMVPVYYEGDEFLGVNGVGMIMIRWGLIGTFLFFFSSFRFFRNSYLVSDNRNWFAALAVVIIFMLFFSNPVADNPLFYLLFFSGFLFRRTPSAVLPPEPRQS